MKKKISLVFVLIFVFVLVFTVQPSTPAKASTGKYQFPWNGSQSADLRTKGNCWMEFDKASSSFVTKCTRTDHTNQIDFGIEGGLGSDVRAAYSGTVVFVKEISNKGCNSASCIGQENVVVIEHEINGSIEYSWYEHLKYGSVPVNKDDLVNVGQKIGEEGNTGYSSGPHLHFMISDKIPTKGWPATIDPDQAPWPPAESIIPADFEQASWSNLVLGATYSSQNYSGVNLYLLSDYVGLVKHFDTATYSPIEFASVNPNSIMISQGWSARVYQNIFGPSFCLNQSSQNLNAYVFSLGTGVKAIEVFNNSTCGTPPPICTLSSQSARPGSLSLISAASTADSCLPTPTPGPGPTPTPTPPPSGNGWNVKAFTAMNECNDSPDCNPTSTFYQSTLSGTNFNLNFSDGKAFGAGTSDNWGMILKQTVNLPSGTYYIHADHDDGVKVWLNGTNKMDVLGSGGNNTTCPGIYLSGQVNLSILWKNTGGPAHLNFSIDQNGAACQPSQKWHVWYYHDPNLCSSPSCALSQVYFETDIYGTWFHIGPDNGYPNGQAGGDSDTTWGSVWKQTINFPDGNYVFHADHDDGIKIFLGDTNIMDVGNNEMNDVACPARHLSGDVPITVIHNNTGGDARINVWWDTNTATCEKTAYNVWTSKDSNNATHVIVENGDINSVNLYFGRSGQQMEITKALWFASGGNIEAIIPSDVDSFLVDQGFPPTVAAPLTDEWYVSPIENHWVIKKKLSVWVDDTNKAHLTYYGETGLPNIRYYVTGGVGGELQTTSWWYSLPDGSGIEAIIPDGVEAVKIDRWITPVVDTASASSWLENNSWLSKKLVVVDTVGNSTKVSYYWGSPLPVLLGRYGQDVETRSDLWQTETVFGHTNYFFYLPNDVVAFEIQGGPLARIDGDANWSWGNSGTGHWVAQKTIWVYEDQDGKTHAFYANPDAAASDVPILFYNYGNNIQQVTTDWWQPADGGIMFTVPDNVVSFLVTRGPLALLTDSATAEWFHNSDDPHWNVRILKPTSTPTTPPTATATPTTPPTSTSTPNPTGTPTPTQTPVITSTPTSTGTQQPTSTQYPPTATATPTSTYTQVPSGTPGPSPTSTNPPVLQIKVFLPFVSRP